MDELISKQAVLDLFTKYKPYMAIKTHEFGARLKALPSAQQWIPCSERLPDEDGYYLTSLEHIDGDFVDVTEWESCCGGRWVDPIDECDYCEIGNVTAWMPLPEAWKGSADK